MTAARATIGILLRAPPSLLESISSDDIRAVIDAGGLEPQSDEYPLEPQIVLPSSTLAERIEILALTPERRVRVRIFD